MAETKQPSTGTVKWFSARKGFGFIATDDDGEDLFVHQTSIQSDGFRTLSEGQPVEFIVDYADDGRAKAINVVAVSRSRRPLRGRGGRGSWRGAHGGRMRGGDGGGGRGFDNYGRGSRGARLGGGGGGRCYNCGRTGHMARDCYHGGDGGGTSGNRRYNDGGGTGGVGRYDGGGSGYSGPGGGRRRRGCYNCGEDGHFARDCPNNEQE